MAGSPDVPMWNSNALAPQNSWYPPVPGAYPPGQMAGQPASLNPMEGLNPITALMAAINAQNIDPMAAFGGSAPAGSMNLSAAMNPMGITGAPGTVAAAAVDTPSPWSDFRDSFVGTKDTPGWGGLAIGGANSMLQGYLGMRQYALAKKQLSEGQRQFDLNYDAQRKTTNSAFEDRQRARVASGNSAYESVDSYMKKYGI